MIFDAISNFKNYVGIDHRFRVVGEYIRNQLLVNPSVGKYDISDGVVVIVSEYLTKNSSQGIIECHQKYIDIQVVLAGAEKIGICSKYECKLSEYDEEKDFQRLEGEVNFITLIPGYFMVFFPDDGHMPQISHHRQQKVRKVVFKIPV